MGSQSTGSRSLHLTIQRQDALFWGGGPMILREVSVVVPLVYFTSKIETLLVSLIEIGSPTIPFCVQGKAYRLAVRWISRYKAPTEVRSRVYKHTDEMFQNLLGGSEMYLGIHIWLWYSFQYSLQSFTIFSLFMRFTHFKVNVFVSWNRFFFFRLTIDLGTAFQKPSVP